MIYFSGNPIYQEIAAGPGLEIRLQLFVETAHYNNNFSKVLEVQRTSGADGKVLFELHNVLDKIVRQGITPPDPNAVIPSFVTSSVRRFFVVVSAEFAQGPVTFYNSPFHHVLAGKVPDQLFPDFDIFSYLHDQQAFLTWQPDFKKVSRTQQKEILSYLVLDATVTSIKLRTRYYGSDGALLVENTGPIPNTGYGRLINIPVQHSAYPTATRVEVELLRTDNSVLAKKRTYLLVDAKPSETSRFFFFYNSLGGWDNLRTTGIQSATLDSSDNLAERILERGYAHTTAQYFVWDFEAQKTIKQATGVKSAAEMHYLQEFLFSKNRYEHLYGKLFPILLKKRALNYSEDNRYRTGYTFEYEYAHKEDAYALPGAFTFVPRVPLPEPEEPVPSPDHQPS